MAFEVRPYPEFSWSQSRRSTFRECPRKYFWTYYGSHNGWLKDASAEARLAWRLKKISNLHMTLGNVVHDIAAEAIQRVRGGGDAPSMAELVDEGRGRLNRAWQLSQRRDDWERAPGRTPMLMEFYRGTGPDRDLIEKIRDRLYACLRNLPASESFREATEAPQVEVKEVDRLDYIDLDGVQTYARPDVLYRLGDAWRIVDWKTGSRAPGHAAQLRTYAVYLRARDDLPGGPIIGRLEYLADGDSVTVPITDRDISEERLSIRDSVAAMRTYLDEPLRNVAKPKACFPLTDNRRWCADCNFFELCEDELAATPDAGPF
ncbi:MAG: PD-(D/E)XK nuclease family protein [Gemmatimonadota bacterium]